MQEFSGESLTAALQTGGYSDEAVDDALMASYLNENKLLHIEEIKRFPEGRVRYELDLTMDWNYARLDQVRVSLLDVPLDHRLIAGVDTRELDQRMAAHDWQYYYSMSFNWTGNGRADEHQILQDLYTLHHHGPAGRDMAEKLLVKHTVHENAWRRYPDLNAAAVQYERRWEPDEIPSIPLGYQMAVAAPYAPARPHDLSVFFEQVTKTYPLRLKQENMYLETRHAQSIVHSLEMALRQEDNFVVFSHRPSDRSLHPMDLDFFKTSEEAYDAADDRERMSGGLGFDDHLIYCLETSQLLENVLAANPEATLKIAGIEVSQLEATMQRIDWNQDYDRFFQSEVDLGMDHSLVNHLVSVFEQLRVLRESEDPLGKQLSDRLMLKHMSAPAQAPVKYQRNLQTLDLKDLQITKDMNLGTPEEAMQTLLDKGYHETIAFRVGAGLADFNDNPIWPDKYLLGADKMYIEWDFKLRPDDGIGHPPLTIHLLQVPIKHEVLQGIDTRELDQRMAGIDWVHPNLSREALTAMAEINKLAMSNEERSENIADRLAVKHWSWAAPNEGNLYLEEKKQEFLVSKTYHDLPKLTTAFKELTDLMSNKQIDHLNEKRMNLNNLEDLRNELATLKFSPDVAEQLEAKMRPLPNYFTLKDQLPGDQGPVNFTLHFKKSNQSDFYNMGKVDVTAGIAPVLPPDQTYMVTSQDPEKADKLLTKHFDNATDAIEFFKKQKANSELGVGTDADSKQLLASKENGKDNYLNREFAPVFNTPPVSQTFYPEKGYGFTAEQCANLVQGRTVYRGDMLTRMGEPFAAWIKLDFEQAKDGYNNRVLNNYHVPQYGFDIDKTLDRYQIKELGDPAQRAELIKSLEAGNRTPVTVLKEGKEEPMKIDLSARFSSVDFFNNQGRREKREQFEKPTHLELGPKKGQAQKEEQQQNKGRKH